MNTAEYIASGILEQYVAGSVSMQEKQEVECMSHIYPEIKLELEALQKALEGYAKAEQKAPPAFLREKILGSLKELQQKELMQGEKTTTPTLTVHTSEQTYNKTEVENKPTMTSSMSWYRAAAAILLLLTSALAFLLFSDRSKSKSLQHQIVSLQQNNSFQKKMLDQKENQIAILSDVNFKRIELNGIPTKSKESKVSVFWNKSTEEVYVSSIKLPTPEPDKEYQLWAIADGKPVDMGMLTADQLQDSLIKMKSIGSAQAFAITLEKKGGVPSPTLTEMYVMGGI